MIKIITNMLPRNSAIMRPLLDGMDKIKAFRRDVLAIIREASKMTCGQTRVCPHEYFGQSQYRDHREPVWGRTGLPRIFVSWKRKFVSQETKIRFLES
jgi:hypothetical protein